MNTQPPNTTFWNFLSVEPPCFLPTLYCLAAVALLLASCALATMAFISFYIFSRKKLFKLFFAAHSVTETRKVVNTEASRPLQSKTSPPLLTCPFHISCLRTMNKSSTKAFTASPANDCTVYFDSRTISRKAGSPDCWISVLLPNVDTLNKYPFFFFLPFPC